METGRTQISQLSADAGSFRVNEDSSSTDHREADDGPPRMVSSQGRQVSMGTFSVASAATDYSRLSVADLVLDDSSHSMLPVAETVSLNIVQRRHQKTRQQQLGLVGILAMVVAIVLTVVFVIVKDNSKDAALNTKGTGNTTQAPTRSPLEMMKDEFLQSLPDYTLHAMEQDLNSPQALALNWLIQDPNVVNYNKER